MLRLLSFVLPASIQSLSVVVVAFVALFPIAGACLEPRSQSPILKMMSIGRLSSAVVAKSSSRGRIDLEIKLMMKRETSVVTAFLGNTLGYEVHNQKGSNLHQKMSMRHTTLPTRVHMLQNNFHYQIENDSNNISQRNTRDPMCSYQTLRHLRIHQRSFHFSSTMLMMASKKKNGGKCKKPKALPGTSNSAKKRKLKKVMALTSSEQEEEEDDDDDDDHESLEQMFMDDTVEGGDSLKETLAGEHSSFASEYHAPVMPTECIQALLIQGEWAELMQAKKDRWRRKKSIIEAKRRRDGYYDDEDNYDENEEDDEVEGNLNENRNVDDEPTIPQSSNLTPENTARQPRLFIDGTLGGGGHSQALLQQLSPGDILIGCDVDPEALAAASNRLVDYLVNRDYILDKTDESDLIRGEWKVDRPIFIPVQSNFRNLLSVLAKVRHPVTGKLLLGDRRLIRNNGYNYNDSPSIESDDEESVEFPFGVNGMLLDLGVSSHQIDTSERGFAFMKNGPLDMRMSGNSSISPSPTVSSSLTAADICNEFDEGSLVSILRTYGDEPRAKRIAAAIVAARPLYTTTDLVHAINSVTPTFARQRRAGLIATSARVFQALRIVVNEEDSALKEVLEDVAPLVLCRDGGHHLANVGGNDEQKNGGILAVLSYHSMEDKMAKRVIRDGSVNLIEGYSRRSGGLLERDLYGNIIDGSEGSVINHIPFEPLAKPRKASEKETEVNSRARSATLRVAIRI